MHSPGGWGWLPGNAQVRPIYAPALVAFIGGSSWEASFRIGSTPVGWFPLGPQEPYAPAYSVSSGYLRAVNAPYVDMRRNADLGRVRYVNRDVPGAFTAVSRDVFRHGRPVNAAVIDVPHDTLNKAMPIQAGPGRPSRDDVTGGKTRGAAPPDAVTNRSVVVRQAPSADTREPFKHARQMTATPRLAPVRAGKPEQTDRPVQERAAPAPRKAAPEERAAPAPKADPQDDQPSGRGAAERKDKGKK